MNSKDHLSAFEERKETIFRWAVEVRGIENSQRIIGDNASRAMAELLSTYLHQEHLVEEGFQLNHAWFKSPNVSERLPDFDQSKTIIPKMIELETLCEKLSYGSPKPVEIVQKVLNLFVELEKMLKEMIK